MLELFSPEQGFEGNTLEEAHCTSVIHYCFGLCTCVYVVDICLVRGVCIYWACSRGSWDGITKLDHGCCNSLCVSLTNVY